jgi:hypothetical protein
LAGLKSGLSLQHEQSHVSRKPEKTIGLAGNGVSSYRPSLDGKGKLFDIGTLFREPIGKSIVASGRPSR